MSPNAAYRHFADRDDLLRAVAWACQDRLADLMEAHLEQIDTVSGPAGAWARLRAAGRAYVDFALAEPGLFRTAFAIPLATKPPPAAGAGEHSIPTRSRPGQILASALDGLVSTGALPAERRPGAEYVAWSAVHGIATLLTTGPLRDLPTLERDAAIDRVINAVTP